MTATKKPSRFKTKTLKRAKINGVKCYLKEVRIKIFENPRNIWSKVIDEHIAYWQVLASDGTNRKVLSREQADKVWQQLIEFEKKQLTIEAI